MARAPVMDSVRAAIAFARANVGRVAGVLGLVMLLNVAGDLAASRFAVAGVDQCDGVGHPAGRRDGQRSPLEARLRR